MAARASTTRHLVAYSTDPRTRGFDSIPGSLCLLLRTASLQPARQRQTGVAWGDIWQ